MFKWVKKTVHTLMVNEQQVIAEIHNEFDIAGERLLKEAKMILAKNVDTDKGERLKKLGFSSAKDAVAASELIKEKEKQSEMAKNIEYYQLWYPNNKFITEELVKKICEKYHLLLGESHNYIGGIPEKNIIEIENFKLREDDMKETSNWDDWYEGMQMRAMLNFRMGDRRPLSDYGNAPKEIIKRKVKPSFKICAPETDFNTRGMSKVGYKLIPDPIVLQPIKGGYLIVSKWGLEASDQSLTNEKYN